MKPTPSDSVSDAELALRGLSRETDLRLDAAGRFWSGQQPIDHPGVADAFARWIERGPTGRYVLRNAIHYVYVSVDDAPLHARLVELDGDQATLVLQGGVREPLRPETLREGPDGSLYASARDGTWPVRLLPNAILGLADALSARGDGVALELGGVEHVIPRSPTPLAP